jgi:hypothetical protein
VVVIPFPYLEYEVLRCSGTVALTEQRLVLEEEVRCHGLGMTQFMLNLYTSLVI